jgi:hypothetical protein
VLSNGRIRPMWRVRGIGRVLRREIVRFPAFHPRVRPAILAGRSSYRWLRRNVLRSAAGERATSLAGRRLIHCFGDRNALVFGELRWRGPLARTVFDLTISEEASGTALLNGSRPSHEFRRVIGRLPRDRTLLFLVGERDAAGDVDTATRGAAGLIAFLDELWRDGRRNLLVLPVPPPASRADGGPSHGEVERALQATTAFNAALRRWATDRGCRFVDYEGDVLDPATGLARERFAVTDQDEFRLDPAPWGEVLANRLREFGYR